MGTGCHTVGMVRGRGFDEGPACMGVDGAGMLRV
jgi:hypothetical protein